MPDVDNPYTPAWLQTHRWTLEPRTRALFAVFAHLGLPESYLDVGCGDGDHVRLVAGLGITACGVDRALEVQLEGDSWSLLPVDLRRPLHLGRRYDLVTCWEVAEHLPASAADTLVASVAGHVGQWLVWTAATPGQGGFHHVNEQPHTYWHTRLQAQGLRYCGNQTAALRTTWKAVCRKAWWYPQNCAVFSRES